MKKDNEKLMNLRHSAEHVLHTALTELYPDIKKVMGPPIKGGYYCDFDLDQSITPEDFPKIEEKMQEIIDSKLDIRMKESSYEEAKEIFSDNKYKLDTLEEINERGEEITLCEMGQKDGKHYDLDLCIGGHVDNTEKIKTFKLISVAGAYYKGDENNKMLQRIYGVAFESEEELNEYLEEVERRKENDHRKVNNFMDIFAFSDLVGKGLVMFTPNGTTVKNELKNYLLNVSKKHGAMEVDIPHLAKIDLYETSGHAEKFADELFKVISHYDEEFVLKPVNCPHHTQIYASRPRSYKELPIAYVESTQQHRDEKPGAMVGLNRTRSFEIDDGHTFCTPDQVKEEAIKLINTMKEFYEVFGMWGKHWVSLSFRDPEKSDKYIGSEEDWEKSQNMLLELNEELKLEGVVREGEAALYGPKIDIMMEDVLGNERQLGTVQVDFAMPKRFGLTYIDSDGQEKTPVMLHRAILGSYGRFIANLMESTGGAFPVWLMPTQIVIIPISEKHIEFAEQIKKKAQELGLRVSVDDKAESMGAKIRNAQLVKTPYMFIVGDREIEDNKVSVRTRENKDLGAIDVDKALEKVRKVYISRSLEL